VIRARAEVFMDTLPELKNLFSAHWEKLALDKEVAPLDPNYEVYGALEKAGALLFIALRNNKKLIGYWVATITPGLHYKTCVTALMDIWNIVPEYENGVAALILMRAVEREYKDRGVNRAFAGEKTHKPCGRLYEAFGYQPVETQYSKLIGQ
jgi:hypothetical protein